MAIFPYCFWVEKGGLDPYGLGIEIIYGDQPVRIWRTSKDS